MAKDKKQESDLWTDRLWHKIKTFAPIALLASCSLNLNANNNPPKTDSNSPELVTNKNNAAPDTKTAKLNIKKLAYAGKYYNEICNGSPCWLASTYETRGAGISGKINSAGTWNDNGGYRGINQFSPQHAQKYLKWLADKPEYAQLYHQLKKGNLGKGNWQNAALHYEDQMTLSQEDYMTEVYNSDNFKVVQDIINKSDVKVNIKKLHPAVISSMHMLMVEMPSSRTKIANKIIDFTKKHDGDEKALNSSDFIALLVSSRSKDVAKQATMLLNDSSIVWKENQFNALLSKVQPLHDAQSSWFSLQRSQENLSPNNFNKKIKAIHEKKMRLAPDFQVQDNTKVELPRIHASSHVSSDVVKLMKKLKSKSR